MEIYDDKNNIFQPPQTSDYSLSFDSLLKLFSCRYRPYLKSTINKYLCSYGDSWLCIVPIRTKYRVIGFVSCLPPPAVVTARFCEYIRGDFETCRNEFLRLCLAFLRP